MIRRLCLALPLLASPAQAQVLDFPSNANLQTEITEALDSYDLPTGIWDGTAIPTKTVEGALTRQAWRIEAPSLTTLQLLRPLREQLRNARFDILFECQTEACGGFDFRFGTEALRPPEMQINIGDFRFLSAERMSDEGPEYISLFVSRTAQAGFVQVTRVGVANEEEEALATTTAPPLRAVGAVEPLDLATRLEQDGHTILEDLTFETGSAQLAPTPFASLTALAEYLLDNPNRTVALVGHTDSSGSLAGNIALSKQRAGSVLERLVSDYGISRAQLEAEGMGYLAPIATNLTEEGRQANRRVEVIITSTE
ncbi:OmpA family protein [Cognatiyoonia sp. IB215446]|uniref:OmpA family protein n=1 Tax=Cognatiyoonia sp. IB215446 TaxID=3097355 RepID=UPI002A0BAC0D|nr:OmpA family protein [Cognatiyoonia sp. IB215446]MDX8346547.1 OmpA family protein [Cognatiyoonia sp. IB215446]